MQSKAEILTMMYDAFNRREIDAVLAHLAPDVDWPNSMEGSRVIGHAAVRGYWLHQWSVVDPKVTPTHIEENKSGETTVTVHQVVHDLSGNLLADQIVLHRYTFEDNLVTAMEVLPAPPA